MVGMAPKENDGNSNTGEASANVPSKLDAWMAWEYALRVGGKERLRQALAVLQKHHKEHEMSEGGKDELGEEDREGKNRFQ